MKRIEDVRKRILRGQQGELWRLRVWLSQVGDNQEAVDKLCGESGDLILARVADFVMTELGHSSGEPVESRQSLTRRIVGSRKVAPRALNKTPTEAA